LLLRDAIVHDRLRSWAAYAILAVASFGLHFVAVLFIGAQLLTLVAVWNVVNRRRALRVIGAVALGVVVLGVVWVLSDQDYWVAWLPALSDERALEVARDLAGGTTIALLLVTAFAVFGSIQSVKALRADRAGSWGDAWLLAGVWVPLLAGAVASVTHPLAYPRYFLAILPPLALLVGRGVAALPRSPTVPAAAAVMVIAAVFIGHPDLDRQAREGINDAAAYVTARAQPGDRILLPYNADLSGFQWYAADHLPEGVVDARPGVPADAIRSDWWWEDPDRLGPDTPKLADLPAEEWRAALRDADRVWTVSGFVAHDPRFHDNGTDFVPEGRVECDRQFFRGIDVVLWSRSCD
jgi:hypothetical protein